MSIIQGVTTIDQDNGALVYTITNTSTQSAAITSGSGIVRISNGSGQHCHIAIGSNPTASVTTSPFLPINTVEFFTIASGHKVAFIGSSASTGSISIQAVD